MNARESELPWFAIHVRSNQEKIVDTILREKGFSTFLPLRRIRSRRRDKVVELELPLFPGYVFSQFLPNDRGPIVTISPVVRVVGIGNCPEPVDAIEIEAVRAIVGSGQAYDPWPFNGMNSRIGEHVTILSGPLSGLSGVLTAVRGAKRVVVSVTLIQRAVAVEVERAWVRPARHISLLPTSGHRKAASMRSI